MAAVRKRGNDIWYTVTSRVGFSRKDRPACPNAVDDVLLVQYMLNKFVTRHNDSILPGGKLAVDGVIGTKTLYALLMFQSSMVGGRNVETAVWEGDEWGCVDPVSQDLPGARVLRTLMYNLYYFSLPREIRGNLTDQPDCPALLRQVLQSKAPLAS